MLPILLQNVITMFVSLLDNIMVGQVGTEQMSGVAIANQILFIFNLCIFGGISGVGIFSAQYYGKQDHDGIRYTVRAKLFVAVTATILFAVVFLTAGGMLVSSFLHEGNEGLDLVLTYQRGMSYLHLMMLQMLPFAVSQVFASTLRECNEAMFPMKASIAATLINLSRAGIFTMCFAICEMVVIISGGIDVSFPAIGCVAMYVPMYLYNNNMGVDSAWFFFGVAILIGLIFGILNGVLVSFLNLPPLIATLATSSVASGGLIMMLGTREFTTLPPSLDRLYAINLLTYTDPGTGFKYPLTILILVPVILCIVVAFVMKYTMLGRGLYAIGGDKNAARVAGFNVRKLQFTAYIFCSVMASATAMMYTTLMHSSTTTALMGEEMIIIAACVVGGCRLTGGHGGVGGTILGVLLITLVRNNLNMLGVPTSWQTFAVGLVLLLGAVLSSIQAKRIRKLGKI